MSAIDDLADRYCIHRVSEDAFGKEHVTSKSTKQALLSAMGINADNEDLASRSLQEVAAQERESPLPPVLVLYPASDRTVQVTLPAHTPAVEWSIALEGGGELSGRSSVGDLKLCQLNDAKASTQEKRLLRLPDGMPPGYHRLQIAQSGAECTLIVTPGTCWLPPEAESRKLWGVSAQIYLLRSENDWGMGDFSDLRTLAVMSQQQGADVVGVNPLHAMFLDEPEQASPYSPSDRLLLNVLYIDIHAVQELAYCTEAQAILASDSFQGKLRLCREAALVQYGSVADLKLPILKLLYSTFKARKDPQREREFAAFHAERRHLLDRACLFQALRDRFTSQDAALADCKAWPETYQSFASAEVERFAQENADLVQFHMWLQWIADEQLRSASDACKGMAIGLYRDLAVGSAPSGAEVWSHPDAMVPGASVGAPPDIWNPAGQNWGLPPLHPHAARRQAYASFIDLIRTNMRYAGALRIDHALALQRLYWIPKGAEPKDGAYVDYPIEDLIGILALESHRNRCMLIGEDLGTVPKGFRERMASAKILSYRVLFFERDEQAFVRPEAYPDLSLSVASSHDLPTLRGWWNGADLDAKERLHLFPNAEDVKKARTQRDADRKALIDAFARQQIDLVPSRIDEQPSTFIDAAHRFLAGTRSMVTLVQIDDMTCELEQVNIPATSEENPNWRRRLSKTLEQLASDPAFLNTAAIMQEAAVSLAAV